MFCAWCQHPRTRAATVLVARAAAWSDRCVRTSLTLARAQLARGWKSLLGLVVLITLVGGLVLAGVAGAQRTRTAVDRMIAATEAADVLVNPDAGEESALSFDAVAALPQVADASRMQGVGVFLPPPYASLEDMFSGSLILASDGGALFNFDRPVLVAGRLPYVDAVDEVYLGEQYASRGGYSVGDTLDIRVLPYADLESASQLADSGELDAALSHLNDPSVGTIVGLRIVGIGNTLDDVAVDEGYEPFGGWIGPAVYSHLGEPSAGYWGAVVRLKDPKAIDEFMTTVDGLAPEEKIVYQSQRVTRAKALRATEPSATALAVFALVTALLGLLLIGQAISRRFQLDSRDNDTLAALGTTRQERFQATLCRLLPAAGAGVLGSVVLATVLSVLTPVGPAAIAEPNPGFDFDAQVVLVGALSILVAVMVLGALPAWRNAGHTAHTDAESGSAIAGWLAGQGASASLTTGVRFGLEPGSGRTAVPTRATIVGALTAVAVATATIVFASSLDRVVSDGKFYGSNFDVIVDSVGLGADASTADFTTAVVQAAAKDPAVQAVSPLRISEVHIDGRMVTTLAFGPNGAEAGLARAVEPTIGAGRAPSAVGEIALGRTTMQQLGVALDDTVHIVSAQFTGDATVVGRAVLPGVGLYQGSDRTSIGVGALVAIDMLGPPDAGTKELVVVDLRDGADLAAFQSRVEGSIVGTGTAIFSTDGRPSDIVSLARLRSLPVALATVLVVLVAFTVLHAMIVAVRRRRRDIAVLQALGSTSGELTAVGVSQGVTIGLAALLFGLPLGIVIGRWLWVLLANAFGTLAEPVVPVAGLLALAAGVIALTAAAGVVPIRRGLRIRPAEVLRSE